MTDQSNQSSGELDIGTRLKFIREQNGLSQRELAKRAGVPHSSISMIEQGQSSPSIHSLAKILSGIPMSLAHFFTCDLTVLPRYVYHVGELPTEPSEWLGISKMVLPLADRDDAISFLQMTYAPGADTGELPIHAGRAITGTVLRGHLELTVNTDISTLAKGDVFCLTDLQGYRLRNISPAEAVLLVCSAR